MESLSLTRAVLFPLLLFYFCFFNTFYFIFQYLVVAAYRHVCLSEWLEACEGRVCVCFFSVILITLGSNIQNIKLTEGIGTN